MTVRSGCECLVGLSIAGIPYVAVPIHVKQNGTRKPLVRVLAKNWITVEQQIYQILHHVVEGLVILAIGDDFKLELVHHGFIKAHQVVVLRSGQKCMNLGSFLQISLPLGNGVLFRHVCC